MKQMIISGRGASRKVGNIIREIKSRKYLLVCGSSFSGLDVERYFDSAAVPYVRFSDFKPNPLYEDICRGVSVFNSECCDAIVTVGGGSAIDVAKCIKLYCKMNPGENYLMQAYRDSGIPIIALPTTAGTGSESTRYAVIYFQGKKQSVTHESIIPDYVILDSYLLRTLPLYQKKCTMLDALCQGIESWWSVNSTKESREYSKVAVETIMKYMGQYINEGSEEAAQQIMMASNYAGRAINIAQTTAAHAMSYMLTAMYHIPHGHAVAVCLPEVWEYMLKNMNKCTDSRGEEYLDKIFSDISVSMGCTGASEAARKLRDKLANLGIWYPQAFCREKETEELADSVNPVRLQNNPVELTAAAFKDMYGRIVR